MFRRSVYAERKTEVAECNRTLRADAAGGNCNHFKILLRQLRIGILHFISRFARSETWNFVAVGLQPSEEFTAGVIGAVGKTHGAQLNFRNLLLMRELSGFPARQASGEKFPLPVQNSPLQVRSKRGDRITAHGDFHGPGDGYPTGERSGGEIFRNAPAFHRTLSRGAQIDQARRVEAALKDESPSDRTEAPRPADLAFCIDEVPLHGFEAMEQKVLRFVMPVGAVVRFEHCRARFQRRVGRVDDRTNG